MNHCVRSVLFCGEHNLTKSLLFETAIHWAEEGQRVIYIAPEKLQSLPIFHDRSKPSMDIYNQIRLMYLADYEALINQLIDLHTFELVPSVLLIDNLDHFIRDDSIKDPIEMHSARLYATILHSMNVCGKVLKRSKVFFCASVEGVKAEDKLISQLYLDRFWKVYEKDEAICLEKLAEKEGEIYKYRKLNNESIVLKQIVKKVLD